MANPKGNPQNLQSYKPKWQSGKTRTIRVPIAIAPLVLEAAREIDNNGNVSLSQVIEDRNKLISELKNQLSTVTSERDELLSEQNNKDSFSVTSDRKALNEAFEDAIAIPSNRGGQIKIAVAAIGKLLGFSIQKTSKGWLITDTSHSKEFD